MEELLEEISSNIDEAYKKISTYAKEDVENHSLEYNNDRSIRETQVGRREDKVTDNDVTVVAKIPIPFQKKIVRSGASFLFGSKIKLVPNEQSESAEQLKTQWRDMRMDSLLLKFATTVKSETQAAIVFYKVEKEGEEPKIRARILSFKNGTIYPVIDNFGTMQIFAWEYQVLEDDKEISYLYVWTADTRYIFKGTGGKWEEAEEDGKVDNEFEKIPVVYMSQDQPEWWDVVSLIDNFEMSFSKFVDTNAYFASPMYKAKGGVDSLPSKDETGKIVKLDIIETDRGNVIEADLDLLVWDRAPESLKLEFDTARDLIYHLTNTTDISRLLSSGLRDVSGIALKLMFFSSILKSYWDQGDYSEAIDRMINVIKSGMANILSLGTEESLNELDMEIVFTSVLPENLKEVIEVLSEATGGKPVMSQKTAVKNNPMVLDDEQEMKDLEVQAQQDNTFDLGGTETL